MIFYIIKNQTYPHEFGDYKDIHGNAKQIRTDVHSAINLKNARKSEAFSGKNIEGKRKGMGYLSWTILSTILLLLGESEAFKDAIIIWKLSREH